MRIGADYSHARQGERRPGAIRHCRTTAAQRAQELCRTAKMQLLYRYDVVSHATASPVTGQLEKHAALELLLRGTGLEAVYSSDNTATIRSISAGDKAGPGTKAATGDKVGPAN